MQNTVFHCQICKSVGFLLPSRLLKLPSLMTHEELIVFCKINKETTVPFGHAISVRQLPFAFLADNVFWNRCMYVCMYISPNMWTQSCDLGWPISGEKMTKLWTLLHDSTFQELTTISTCCWIWRRWNWRKPYIMELCGLWSRYQGKSFLSLGPHIIFWL